MYVYLLYQSKHNQLTGESRKSLYAVYDTWEKAEKQQKSLNRLTSVVTYTVKRIYVQ